jgi:hypothetical protein
MAWVAVTGETCNGAHACVVQMLHGTATHQPPLAACTVRPVQQLKGSARGMAAANECAAVLRVQTQHHTAFSPPQRRHSMCHVHVASLCHCSHASTPLQPLHRARDCGACGIRTWPAARHVCHCQSSTSLHSSCSTQPVRRACDCGACGTHQVAVAHVAHITWLWRMWHTSRGCGACGTHHVTVAHVARKRDQAMQHNPRPAHVAFATWTCFLCEQRLCA